MQDSFQIADCIRDQKDFRNISDLSIDKIESGEKYFDCFKMDETAKLEKADISQKM